MTGGRSSTENKKDNVQCPESMGTAKQGRRRDTVGKNILV